MLSITIAGKPLPYTLKISARRRTLGLRVDQHGLTVHIPTRVPQHTVESLLQDKADWIARKLAEWQERPGPASMEWQDGAALQHLGQEIQLVLRQDARNRAVEFDGARLYVALPNPDDSKTVQRKVAQWYTRQARADFTRRIELLAARLGVPTPKLFLSNAQTRWGSCNSKGEIRLHWRLIQAPPHIIHYVVAHELAHLKEMNHSPKFWAWVEKLCPDYTSARNELKALSASLHLL
ncbi:MAG TPA: SprT family zinc-dependent metalloprotease [Methylophilaceae bacterium]|nr:SprT family zinc-dependent metalloprotease [Methylophilaceae bacterium]